MSDWHTQVKYESEIPCVCVQMGFQFISGVAVWCPEAYAKATVLTMVVRWSLDGLGQEPRQFRGEVDSVELRVEKTRLTHDNEPAMRPLAEKFATLRHPRTTILEPINRTEHQSVGGDEESASEYSRLPPEL